MENTLEHVSALATFCVVTAITCSYTVPITKLAYRTARQTNDWTQMRSHVPKATRSRLREVHRPVVVPSDMRFSTPIDSSDERRRGLVTRSSGPVVKFIVQLDEGDPVVVGLLLVLLLVLVSSSTVSSPDVGLVFAVEALKRGLVVVDASSSGRVVKFIIMGSFFK